MPTGDNMVRYLKIRVIRLDSPNARAVGNGTGHQLADGQVDQYCLSGRKLLQFSISGETR